MLMQSHSDDSLVHVYRTVPHACALTHATMSHILLGSYNYTYMCIAIYPITSLVPSPAMLMQLSIACSTETCTASDEKLSMHATGNSLLPLETQ